MSDTTAPPVTIVEFLAARLDEAQERVDEFHEFGCELTWTTPFPCNCGYPAHVLADITAKRAIITEYERAHERRRAHPDDLASAGALLALHGVVRLLASVHSDHPDYRQEWKPQ